MLITLHAWLDGWLMVWFQLEISIVFCGHVPHLHKYLKLTSGCSWPLQHMRKNVYEEQLFRSEDERFELDMVIECGASAIRAMAPLAAQLAPLTPDVKANWRLPSVRRPCMAS